MNVVDSFWSIITSTCIISEIDLCRHSIHIYVESSPTSFTENIGIMRLEKLYSLGSKSFSQKETRYVGLSFG